MAEERGVEIAIDHDGWTEELAALAQRAAHAALEDEAGQISILLTGDAAIRALNLQFRGKDKPTNVLSFPAADMPGNEAFLGDIAVAFETALQEAAEQGKALGDHLSHLIVHGMLHLLGEDHETADDAERMEMAERRILARLAIADPYRDTVPDSA
jgi:probable rRNA maturation factor